MDGYFYADGGETPSDWTNGVLNYIGPRDGHLIRIYQDGVQTGSDVAAAGGPSSQGQGRVVVGREFTHLDEKYASVAVDELMFFNQTLNDQQILDLKNLLWWAEANIYVIIRHFNRFTVHINRKCNAWFRYQIFDQNETSFAESNFCIQNVIKLQKSVMVNY